MPDEARRPRVDWRFLVGDAPPRSALVVGGPGPWRRGMRDALAAAGVDCAEMPDVPDGIVADVVVGHAGDRSTVTTLAGRADRPVAIDVPRGAAWPRIERPHLRLVAWPNATSTTELVPVASPDARGTFLERRGRRGGIRSRMARVLLHRPLAPTLDRLVVADRDGGEPALLAVARRFSGELLAPAGGAWTLVTPRFQTSGHVVLLVADAVVLKAQRDPAGTSVRRESEALRAVEQRLGSATSFAPRLLGADRFGEHPVLVETALRGVPLTPERAARSAPEVARSLAASLRGLVTGTDRLDGPWRSAVIDGPMRTLRAALDPAVLEPTVLDRIERSLVALGGASLPVAIEHGDFADPNLLVDAEGRIGAIDWELGTVRGVAMLDLAFAIGYLAGAEARASAADGEAVADAWERVALSPDGWGAGLLAREASALGIEAGLLRPLLVLTWVRQLAGLVGRLPTTDRARTLIGSHRYLAVLRRTLERSS